MSATPLDFRRAPIGRRHWRVWVHIGPGAPSVVVDVPGRFGARPYRDVIPFRDPSDVELAHDYGHAVVRFMAASGRAPL